jgi:uncharacterized membrane protein YgcG
MKCLTIAFGLSVIFCACSSSKKVTSDTGETTAPASVVSAITVDGKSGDWQNVPRQTTADGTIEYAVANNNDDLFVLFRIANSAEQMKLIRGGMEVWFDPTGKHAKTTEIIYPVKGELPDETFRPNFVQGEKPNLNDMHRRIESGLISFNRIGFKPAFSGVQSIRENTGFKGALNWDDSEALVYEVAIPFAAFSTDVKKEPMEMGFFIGAVDEPKTGDGAKPSEEGRGMAMGGGMRGGGGGRRGGGGGYGGGRQRGEANQQNAQSSNAAAWKKMYEPQSFWVRYQPKQNIL